MAIDCIIARRGSRKTITYYIWNRYNRVSTTTYRWNRYNRVTSYRYYWDRYDVVETTIYNWNRYNLDTKTVYKWNRSATIIAPASHARTSTISNVLLNDQIATTPNDGAPIFGTSSDINSYKFIPIHERGDYGWAYYFHPISPITQLRWVSDNSRWSYVTSNNNGFFQQGWYSEIYSIFYPHTSPSGDEIEGEYEIDIEGHCVDDPNDSSELSTVRFILYTYTRGNNGYNLTFKMYKLGVSTTNEELTSDYSDTYPINETGDDGYYYEYIGQETEQIIGSSAGTITSTSSSAYPQAGAQGNYWYVYTGTTTEQSKGSSSTRISSTSSSAYPQDGIQGNYWYVYDRSSTSYSQGSYIDQVTSTNRNQYPDNSYSGSYWYVYSSSSTSYSQGSYIDQVTSTERNKYPDNSYSGNYWYVYQGITNETITSQASLNSILSD